MATALVLRVCMVAAKTESPEGRLIKRLELVSEGPLRRITTSDLLDLIRLREGKPYLSSESKHTIQRLYATELFHDVRIETEPVGDQEVNVRVLLIRRFHIREISFEGDLKIEVADLRRELAFRVGEAFYPDLMEETLARVQELYQVRGYFKVRIEPEYEVDRELAFLKIRFRVEAGEQARVAQLQFDLDSGIDAETVRSIIKTRVRAAYSQVRMDGDIAALQAYLAKQGYLNPDIYLRGGAVYDAASNTVSLTLRIVPRERSELRFEGIDPNAREIKDLPLYAQPGSARAFLQDSIDQVKSRLQEGGYFLADVRYDIQGTDEQQRITIHVDKKKKYRIGAITFEGNASIPEDRLRGVARIREAGFFGRGEFNDRLLQDDAERIRSFYEQQGYKDVRVRSEVRPDKPAAGDLTVVFHIEEGPQCLVRSVEIVGNKALDREALEREVTTVEGEPFSLVAAAQDRVNLLAAYERLGYWGTDIRYEISYPGAAAADVKYVIQEGPKRFVEQIVTTGLIQTRPATVGREIVLEEGGPLSFEQVLATETNLHSLGIFNRVDVKDVPSYSDPNFKNVIIRVEEARKYNLLYGIGYSSFEGARGTFGVSDSNFLGAARTLSLGLRAGRQRQRGNITYTIPRFYGWKLPTVFSAAVDNEQALTRQTARGSGLLGRPFDVLRLIGSAQAERRLSARESFFVRLNFQNVRIKVPPDLATPLQFYREEERVRLSATSLSYLNESRDDPVNPTTGFFLSGDASLSSKVIGSDRQFFRILTQGQYYHPVLPRVTFAASLRLGVILPFANTALPGVENLVPISERFFSGGATTLRGLPQDLAGPLLRDPETDEIILVDDYGRPDPNGRPVPLGGNGLVIANAELRFPLFWFLSGAVFYDTGNVFKSITDLSQAGFSNALGLGVRANTPVGPIRFDVGYNPDPPTQVGFKYWNFHFTIGHPF